MFLLCFQIIKATNMPDRFQVTKTDEDTVLDYLQDESASGKLLGDNLEDLQGNYMHIMNIFKSGYIKYRIIYDIVIKRN